MKSITPVILSGGSGTRLWPLSREAHPKQFLPVIGEHSLLQATAQRLKGLNASPPIVVANESHRFLVAEQLQELGMKAGALLLEPVGRNTAPAIAAAAYQAMAADEHAVLLVMPSDHAIRDIAGFQAAVAEALPIAEKGGFDNRGAIVTFGIVPDAPETGFGYIKASAGEGVRAILRFVEKPDSETAQAYVASGDYFWNSGMFLFKASRYLEELALSHPDMVRLAKLAVDKAKVDADFIRLDNEAFAAMAIGFHRLRGDGENPKRLCAADCGRLERCRLLAALWQVSEQDGNGNAHHGDVLAIDCRNTLAIGEKRLVALLGLEDIVVVDTDDAVLVAHNDRVQEVKDIVAKLKAEQGRRRPGTARFIGHGAITIRSTPAPRFQVKRIMVKPGAQLSLQMHHHRAEHWIVVSGTAKVTCDDKVFMLARKPEHLHSAWAACIALKIPAICRWS